MSEVTSAPKSRTAVVKDTVTEWAFATGWQVVKWLPEKAAYKVFEQAADQLWRKRGGGVIQFEKNQARIHPEATPEELRELSRLGMRSYLRYWCEAFRLPAWSPSRVNSTFDLEDKYRMDDAVAAGTGALMVVGHFGNWDHAGAWACMRYGGLTTVAERLKPEGLFDRFVAYRESLGMDIVPLGDPDVIRRLTKALKAGRLVPLLGDRDISRNGVIVDFFGEPASLPAGPAVLGLLTGAPVMPVILWYDGPNSTGIVLPPIEIPTEGTKTEKIQVITQRIAHAYEQPIREHSVDWHMMQPVWLADLDPSRRKAE